VSGRPVWYERGLRFTCTQCNACCGGAPGYVWVDEEDVARIAAFLGISATEFARRYCRKVWWRVSLKEMPDGDCVFLTPQGCRVYSVRPVQCRTFPFWRDLVVSPGRWEGEKDRCPGIGRGRLYSRREIEQIGRGERDT
jgi:Fe-S-cluster containining protein